MLYEPPVLFLDEPTVGLDVVAKERIRSFIEQINRERKTTVLLTTHDLGDVERLCNRIVIIDHGNVLFDGPTQDLKRRYAPHRMVDVVVDAPESITNLGQLPDHIAIASQDGMKATFQVDPDSESLPETIAWLAARLPIIDLGVREPALEGIIREIYETREVTV